MKLLSVLLALAGLLAVTALVGWFGMGEVWGATGAIGWDGFAWLVLAQAPLFAVLATAWTIIAQVAGSTRSVSRNFAVHLWGRMVRDSTGNCLPFTHMAGFLAGIRVVSLHGVSPMRAGASTVADVTAETVAQAIFAALGLIIMLLHVPQSPVTWPVAVGLMVILPCLGAFMAMQQGASRIFARLSRRIASDWFTATRERAQVLSAEFTLIYGHTGRLVACVLIHLLGWVGSGGLTWLSFRLLGAEISLADAVALDGVLHAITAIAFVIPGAVGVQEAGFVGLGAAFGIAPEAALAASLLKRARDLAWGVPVLLVWQLVELRRLKPQRGTRPSSG